MIYQLESKYKEFEGISSSQNVDFPAKLLRGILEVSFFFYHVRLISFVLVLLSFAKVIAILL